MIYTVRFAHLSETPLRPGQIIKRGDIIGVMGETGAVQGIHLHLDAVKGLQTGRYTLDDMDAGTPEPADRQAILFIDFDLFRFEPVVTFGCADPSYYWELKKVHRHFDVVPKDRKETTKHYTIYWNRSMPGRVVKIMDNDPGYGNCAQIAFEA